MYIMEVISNSAKDSKKSARVSGTCEDSFIPRKSAIRRSAIRRSRKGILALIFADEV